MWMPVWMQIAEEPVRTMKTALQEVMRHLLQRTGALRMDIRLSEEQNPACTAEPLNRACN